MKQSKKIFPLLTSLVLSCLASIARSETGQTTKTPSWLQVSFEQRTRYERLTNPFRLKEFGAERLLPLRTRIKLEIGESKKPVRFLVEFQDSRAFYDKNQLFFLPTHVDKYDFLQLQIQLNSENFLGRKLASRLAAGRFTIDLGKRRLAARNNMRNTTNSFDGIWWTLSRDPAWKVQAIFTSPVIIDPEKLDSSSRHRFFWGVDYESIRLKWLNTEAYYLGLHEDDRTVTQRRYSTFGLRLYKKPSPGTVDFELESAWQFGTNKNQDHFSHFQHGELGYSVSSGWNPRLSFQYDYAEGDANPQDDDSGRFDTLFGARAFELIPTGIFSPFYRSNLSSPGIRVVLNPTKKLALTVSYRVFRLARAKDAWVGSGLRDASGLSGKSLGQNLETAIRWRPKGFFLLELGYSRFFKGSYLSLVPNSPGTADSNYFYIATEIRAKVLPF